MLERLLSPLAIGPVEVPNRIASTAHQTTLVHDHLPTEDVVSYHEARPAVTVTLLAGRCKGARVNAGRLGYPHRGQILERNDAGEIVAARLERPPRAPYGRIEVVDARGETAWTNPLWI